MDALRYYLAYNRGLEVRDAALRPLGTFFEGHTLEHLTSSTAQPEIVFAAVAYDGGYRTRDAGATWEKVLDGDVRTFTIDSHDERVIYAGIGPVRLLRSEDGGTTWEALDGMLDFPPEVKHKWDVPPPFRGKEEPHVRYILVHPDDANLLFVLLEHGGVLRSRDRGKTWADCSTGIDYVDVHVIENFPGSATRYYLSSAQGFYRTDDAGDTWYRTEHGMPWYQEGQQAYSYSHEWKAAVRQPAARFVVCGARGSPGVWIVEKTNPRGHILLSDDAGAHWRIATNGLGKENPWAPWVLVSHPNEPKTLFCGMGTTTRAVISAATTGPAAARSTFRAMQANRGTRCCQICRRSPTANWLLLLKPVNCARGTRGQIIVTPVTKPWMLIMRTMYARPVAGANSTKPPKITDTMPKIK